MEIRSPVFMFNLFSLTTIRKYFILCKPHNFFWKWSRTEPALFSLVVIHRGQGSEGRKMARHSGSWRRVRHFNFPYSLIETFIFDAFVRKSGLCCNNTWTPNPHVLQQQKFVIYYIVGQLWLYSVIVLSGSKGMEQFLVRILLVIMSEGKEIRLQLASTTSFSSTFHWPEQVTSPKPMSMGQYSIILP